MHCHCGTNNRAPRWTLQTRGETRCPGGVSVSAWLAAPAMNARDTTKGIYIYGDMILDV